MRIVVFEYVSGGGLCQEPLPAGLLREGELMLGAVLEDLAELPGLQLEVLRDGRLPAPPWAALAPCGIVPVDARTPAAGILARRLPGCDGFLPIAPETGGVLEALCTLAQELGAPLLGPDLTAVRLCTSKSATLERLARHGLPVVPWMPLKRFDGRFPPPWVLKPDDGCGCEGVRLIDTRAALDAWHCAGGGDAFIMQPFITGVPVSLSVLYNRGTARLLAVNRQEVRVCAGGFHLHGLEVNAYADPDGAWQALASRIASALPELGGYAGVDAMLTPSGPLLLEVNPRLTTAYAGLRRALGRNPAPAMLRLAQGDPREALSWRAAADARSVRIEWS